MLILNSSQCCRSGCCKSHQHSCGVLTQTLPSRCCPLSDFMMKVNNWFHYMALDYKMGTHAIQLHLPWLRCVCNNNGNERSAQGGRYGGRDPFIHFTATLHRHTRRISAKLLKTSCETERAHTSKILTWDRHHLLSDCERKYNWLSMRSYHEVTAEITGERNTIHRISMLFIETQHVLGFRTASLSPRWQAKISNGCCCPFKVN